MDLLIYLNYNTPGLVSALVLAVQLKLFLTKNWKIKCLFSSKDKINKAKSGCMIPYAENLDCLVLV